MITLHADHVTTEDADTLKVRPETPLVVDTKDKTAWPRGRKGRQLERDRYEVRDYVWVRLPNLDTHESHTQAGTEETGAFEDWLATAEAQYNADEYELTLYAPGTEFDLGAYDRVLAKLLRRCDGDDWETSALTKFGNSVAWREQTPE